MLSVDASFYMICSKHAKFNPLLLRGFQKIAIFYMGFTGGTRMALRLPHNLTANL